MKEGILRWENEERFDQIITKLTQILAENRCISYQK